MRGRQPAPAFRASPWAGPATWPSASPTPTPDVVTSSSRPRIRNSRTTTGRRTKSTPSRSSRRRCASGSPRVPANSGTVPLRIRLTRRGPVISDHGMGVAFGELARHALERAEGDAGRTGAWALFARRRRTPPAARSARARRPTTTSSPTRPATSPRHGGRVPGAPRRDGSGRCHVTDGADAWAASSRRGDAGTGQPGARGWWQRQSPHGAATSATPYPPSFAASWRSGACWSCSKPGEIHRASRPLGLHAGHAGT